MTKTELMELVGKNVEIIFKDGRTEKGILGFTKEFSAKYGYRKPDYFTINDISFKVSHVSRVRN